MNYKLSLLLLTSLLVLSCKTKQQGDTTETIPVQILMPAFSADSSYAYCQAQCDFGPRTMNSEAHDKCRDWITSEFRRHGCTVDHQSAELKGYDGTMLHATNIIAHAFPERNDRIMLCAHYDSRPWADNDPNPDNHHTPVMAANDGASGVAVMLEIARLVHTADTLGVGIDFICFDAEDYGTPQWFEGESQVKDPWALGAQYWSQQIANAGYKYRPRFGILLDMVGGQGTQFYRELNSMQAAPDVVNIIWQAAHDTDNGNIFIDKEGTGVDDDHISVNTIARIPCADIIPYCPQLPNAPFGATWHTVNDTMDNISRATLLAVGQTIMRVLYTASLSQ